MQKGYRCVAAASGASAGKARPRAPADGAAASHDVDGRPAPPYELDASLSSSSSTATLPAPPGRGIPDGGAASGATTGAGGAESKTASAAAVVAAKTIEPGRLSAQAKLAVSPIEAAAAAAAAAAASGVADVSPRASPSALARAAAGLARGRARRPSAADDVLVVDELDSFTYNLVQMLLELGARVRVLRADAPDAAAELARAAPRRVLLSPGPGAPAGAALSHAALARFAGVMPVLGVCLGLQVAVEAAGGRVAPTGETVHGKPWLVAHDGRGVLRGLPAPLRVVRYHSLAAERSSLAGGGRGAPASAVEAAAEPPAAAAAAAPRAPAPPPPFPLVETARALPGPPAGVGSVQGARHREYTLEGVQWHPESVLSEGGHALMANFLALTAGRWDEEEEDFLAPPPRDVEDVWEAAVVGASAGAEVVGATAGAAAGAGGGGGH